MWYEHYHISLAAITTREIFIFTPLNENKSHIYRKNLNISSMYMYMLIVKETSLAFHHIFNLLNIFNKYIYYFNPYPAGTDGD